MGRLSMRHSKKEGAVSRHGEVSEGVRMTPKTRELRINWLAAVLVVAVGLIVGLAVFFIMRETAETLLRRSLESNVNMQAQWVAQDLKGANQRLRMVATRPFFAAQIAAANRHRPIAAKMIRRGLQSFLSMGFSAITLRTRHGADVARAGHFMAVSALAVHLVGLKHARLLWDLKRGFVLRADIPVWRQGHRVGEALGEVPLPVVTRLFGAVKRLGASADLALCAPRGTDMTCFPTTLNPKKIFPNMARSRAGSPLPMSYALSGRSGFVVARNYRARDVAAAYTPVSSLGLGMVLSQNTTALYAPVRQRLWAIVPLMGVVLIVAMLVLRWQMAPLVAQLVASEAEAQEAVSRWRRSEGYVQAVLQHVNEGITTISERGLIETFNPAMERLFGYTESEIVGQNIALLMPEPHRSQHDAYLQRYRETGETHVIGSEREVSARHRDGSEFPIDLRVSEFFLEGRRRFIGTVRDATGRKAIESRMQHVATHDALTDLPNRTLIQVRMEQLIRRSERSGQLFAVMFVDLDRFKIVNDSLGHNAGDQLLCLVARRLTDTLRVEDTVGRQGGDEFIVLAASLVAPIDAALIAEKILQTLSVPYVVEGHSLYLGASIGVALYPQDGRDVDTLLRRSDLAMYQAKGAGRNTYRYFAPALNAVATDRLILAAELHRALGNGELVLHYEPVVFVGDGHLAAIEALIRWRHPQRGLITADQFLAITEEAGLTVSLGEWALTQACRQFRLWTEQGVLVPRLIMNLSPHQFRDHRLTQSLRAILTETGMDPRRLGVEMTEDGVMENPREAIGILNEWRASGVEVSLDKFGAGYSSLSYLKQLPLDIIKIDPSFIRDLPTDADGAAMVAAIIVMAHQLKIRVVAEGVETAEQYAFLRAHDCDACQGHYVGPPLEPEDCAPYLRGTRLIPLGVEEV